MSVTALVVDDDPLMRGLFSSVLKQLDIDVVGEAENGRDGVDLAVQYDPDLILLDIMMPEMNGYLALEEIIGRVPNAFVVMLTGVDDPEVKEQCRLSGAQDYIVKTASLTVIAERVISHIQFLRSRPFVKSQPRRRKP